MFVPMTANGALKKKLQEKEEHLEGKGKIRYVEKSGTKLEAVLLKGGSGTSECGRDDCYTCLTG